MYHYAYDGVMPLTDKNFLAKCVGKPEKRGRGGVQPFHIIYIIAQRRKKVKRSDRKKQNKTKISIFIDEKIYSVDRLKKIKEQH